MKALSKRYYLSVLTASTPPMTSLCPEINFVAECTTMSKREKGQLKFKIIRGNFRIGKNPTLHL
jgi:hypothetical protein